MKAALIGASAGLGRALAEALAARGWDLYLVASDGADLSAIAKDLTLRHGIMAQTMAVDLVQFDAAALRNSILMEFGTPDLLALIAGQGDDADNGPLPPAALRRILAVNFEAGVAILNAFQPDMLQGRIGICLGIGSVAAIRPRGSNMAYGAAKRGLEFYFEALRHRLRTSRCRVQFYRVGFMQTAMLGDRRTLLPAAAPEAVADSIIGRLDRSAGVSYLPGWWRIVAWILQLLPWTIFRRLDI